MMKKLSVLMLFQSSVNHLEALRTNKYQWDNTWNINLCRGITRGFLHQAHGIYHVEIFAKIARSTEEEEEEEDTMKKKNEWELEKLWSSFWNTWDVIVRRHARWFVHGSSTSTLIFLLVLHFHFFTRDFYFLLF